MLKLIEENLVKSSQIKEKIECLLIKGENMGKEMEEIKTKVERLELKAKERDELNKERNKVLNCIKILEEVASALETGGKINDEFLNAIEYCCENEQMSDLIRSLDKNVFLRRTSLETLSYRFVHDVEKAVRQAILVGDNRTAFRHMIAFVFANLSKNDSVYVTKNGPHETLSRTGYYIRKKDLISAVEEIDKLEGFSRYVSSSWAYEARKHLELLQIISVFKAYLTYQISSEHTLKTKPLLLHHKPIFFSILNRDSFTPENYTVPHPKFFNIQKDVKDEGFKHIDYLIKALPKIKNRKRALTVIFAQQVAGGVLQGLNVNEREAAASKVEVELNDIRPGTVKHVVYRGDPIFVFHRTPDEISEAEAHDGDEMRDPQKDAERVKDKRWLVVVGVCTHLGCVPTVKAGTYKGFFCTCHGSHFDLSGRIRAGPAARNLLVPKYRFKDEHTLLLG